MYTLNIEPPGPRLLNSRTGCKNPKSDHFTRNINHCLHLLVGVIESSKSTTCPTTGIISPLCSCTRFSGYPFCPSWVGKRHATMETQESLHHRVSLFSSQTNKMCISTSKIGVPKQRWAYWTSECSMTLWPVTILAKSRHLRAQIIPNL